MTLLPSKKRANSEEKVEASDQGLVQI